MTSIHTNFPRRLSPFILYGGKITLVVRVLALVIFFNLIFILLGQIDGQ